MVAGPEADLSARLAADLGRSVDPAVTQFAARLAGESGALAVVFYGSNLRTRSLEGVLDFYVLQAGEAERGIWPRVSYREWDYQGATLRAKIASMTLTTFEQAATGQRFDTTIWARFVQPCALIWVQDDLARSRVLGALTGAVCTAARLAIAVGPQQGAEEDYWKALFRATYRSELRVEKPGREDSILSANQAHFQGLLQLAMQAQRINYTQDGDEILPALSPKERRKVLAWWKRRRRLGKPINILRLIRATATFDGAARYAAWKVERHTGVAVEVTAWREKHPILAAPGFAWKVWRGTRNR